MLSRRAALFCLAVASAGCSDARTSVELLMSAPGLSLTSLNLIVAWGGQTRVTTSLPTGGGRPQLPASVLLLLPDASASVDVTLEGNDETFGALRTESSVMTRPHHQVKLPMVLAASPAPDLATADRPAIDLASPEDLSSARDMAVAMDDLSTPPDLKPNPLVQLGAITTGTSTLSASLPGPSRAGTLLVFTMAFDKNADPNGPAGWARYSSFSAQNDAEIWYLANNAGGIVSASATLAGAINSVGQMSEWSVGANFDVAAYCNSSPMPSPSPCDTATTTGMHNGVDVGHTGELALSCFSEYLGSAGTDTIMPSSGWTVVGDNGTSSTKLHYQFSYQLGPTMGMPLREGPSSATSGSWAGAIIAFF
jgi:hypothetical protein